MIVTDFTPFERIKAIRDCTLQSTDWTQTADAPLSAEKKAEWAEFRQKLRDLPETYNEETQEVDWPIAPD
jgi:hypothetical protein|tara:strand:+ start:463 stop:672 length:210 start_codon:yes stop_codon:yes gene_type:complete